MTEKFLFAYLRFDVSAGSTGPVLARLFDGLFRQVCLPWSDQVKVDAPPGRGVKPAIGACGAQFGIAGVLPGQWYSEAGYTEFIEGVRSEAGDPSLDVGTVSDWDTLVGFMPLSVGFSWRPSDPPVGWLMLACAVSLVADPVVERVLVSLLRDVLDEFPIIAGDVEVRQQGVERRVWLQLLAEQVGNDLGGVTGLAATGLFDTVEHLGRGGYWLQVGDRVDSLDPEATRAANRYGISLAPAVRAAEDAWRRNKTLE